MLLLDCGSSRIQSRHSAVEVRGKNEILRRKWMFEFAHETLGIFWKMLWKILVYSPLEDF